MNKIYCVYCGTLNDLSHETCSKCKKELNPKEHIWRDYFYDEVCGKIKGKVTDSAISLIVNYVKSHLYGIVLMISLIATSVMGVVAIMDDHFIDKVDTKPVLIQKVEELSIDDSLVKQLYQYQNYNDDLYLDVITDDDSIMVDFYEKQLVTYESLSDQSKIYMAYKNTNLEAQTVSYQSCEAIKGYDSFYKLCLQDKGYVIGDEYGPSSLGLYKINTESFDHTYYQIFGSDRVIPRERYRVAPARACDYNKDTKDYLCAYLTEGWMSGISVKTKLVRAVKIGSKIELYDYFILLDEFSDHSGTYRDKDKTMKISDQCDENLVEQGQLYKHTYQLDQEGNYVWISSEPVDILPQK